MTLKKIRWGLSNNLFLWRHSLIVVLFSLFSSASTYSQDCKSVISDLLQHYNIDLKPTEESDLYSIIHQRLFDTLTQFYQLAANNLEYESQFTILENQERLLKCETPTQKLSNEQVIQFRLHRAVYNNNIGNLKSAELYLNKIIKSVPEPLSESQQTYETVNYAIQQLAEIEVKRSNLNKAILHLKQSINLEKERSRDTIPSLASMQCRLAEVYDMLGDEDKALSFFQLANDYFIYELNGLPPSSIKVYNYHYIGYLSKEIPAALRTRDLERTRKLLREIENIKSPDHIKNNWIDLLKSSYHQTIDQLDSSSYYLDLAYENIFGVPKNYDQKLTYYLKLADHHERSGQEEDALSTLTKACEISEQIKIGSSKWSRNMISAQTRKIELLHALGSDEESLQEIKKFTSEVNEKLSGSVIFEDHISHINDFYPIFELGLDIIFSDQSEQNRLLAFDIIECTKAISLYKESSLATSNFSKKKDSLLLKYKTLSAINSQLTLNEMASDTNNIKKQKLYNIRTQLFEIKKELSENIDLPVELSLKDFQKSMTKKDLFVLAFAGQRNYYFLQIEKNNSQIHRREKLELQGQVRDFISSISTLKSNLYENTCKSLGSALKGIFVNGQKSNLVFSGDGILAQVPLEALLISDTKFLLEHSNICYSPSAKIYFFLKQKGSRNGNKVAIFRPSFSDAIALDYAEKESAELQKMMKGQLFENDRAEKEVFITKAYQYDLLHLASHAHSYSDQASKSYIAFSNSRLYFDEIKSIVVNAELVYLAACETSTGQSFLGEGVQSLARNFIAAGANSVVSSLWPISDQTTSEITISFYSYLKSGLTKSEALKRAKLDFIEAHPIEGRHPYYWAGLVINGNEMALYSSISKLEWVCICLSLLFSLILLYKISYPKHS